MSREDLPEGVPDATPAGGWESADTADDETAEQNDQFVESAEIQQGLDPDLSTDAQS